MLKWTLRGLAILILLVVVVVVFALEPIAKFMIESEGSKQLGAKVEVDSVDIDFYPTHVALHGLTAANPKEPMRNLFTSETVSADVDIKALLKKQVIADKVLLSGLQMYTERSTPGTLDGSMPPAKDEQGGGLPNLKIPDANALIAEEKSVIKAEVDSIQGELQSIQNRWQETSQEMPDKAQVEDFKQRWDELKKKNALERIAGAKQLRDDIKAELDQFKGLNNSLKDDIKAVGQLTSRAAELPASQAKRMLQKYGLDQGSEGMLKFLLGNEVNDFVQRGLTLYQEFFVDMAEAEPAPEPQGGGELPVNILIRQILIDGYQVIGGEKLAYYGEINDVTDKQDYWNKPITMALQGGMEQRAQLLVDGIFDQRGETLKSVFNLGLEQLALSGVSLSKSPDLPLALEKGLANIAAKFSIDGNDLNGSVEGLINQAKLLVGDTAADNDTAKALAQALEGVSRLVMDLNVKGSVDDPIVRLKSNLDSILGDVLGARLKSELAEVETELRQHIKDDYGDQISALQEKQGMLGQYQELLGDREAAFQALLKQL